MRYVTQVKKKRRKKERRYSVKVTVRIKKTMIPIWTICCFLIPICLLLSITQFKYAHAEGKKSIVTYTENNTIRLERTRIPIPDLKIGIGVSVRHAILSSADPNWNNARYFYVSIQKLNEEHGNRNYGTIIHPSGDQIFVKQDSKLISSKGTHTEGKLEGSFLGGTGKYEKIKGRFDGSWKKTMSEGLTVKWKIMVLNSK
jgi:hypothetical protein